MSSTLKVFPSIILNFPTGATKWTTWWRSWTTTCSSSLPSNPPRRKEGRWNGRGWSDWGRNLLKFTRTTGLVGNNNNVRSNILICINIPLFHGKENIKVAILLVSIFFLFLNLSLYFQYKTSNKKILKFTKITRFVRNSYEYKMQGCHSVRKSGKI